MKDLIAQERYMQMTASKIKPFTLQHCWRLLEHSKKRRLRYQEAPLVKNPRSSSLSALDLDDDERDEGRRSPTPRTSKGRPKEEKKANDIMN
jgi:hypothetical protein